MKKKVIFCFATLCFSGCGILSDDCKDTTIAGTYFVSANTVSGNCGDMDSFVVNMGQNDDECVYSRDEFNRGECRQETSVSCIDYKNRIMYSSAFVLDVDPDGNAFEGTMTVEIDDLYGRMLCIGTYWVKYTKQ